MDLIDQIIFWTEISKEHPIVIDKFAELSDIQLPMPLVSELLQFSERFESLQREARILKETMEGGGNSSRRGFDERLAERELNRLRRRFAELDRNWINFLREVIRYGQYDPIFQTLIEHIIDEQTYAYQVITTGAY